MKSGADPDKDLNPVHLNVGEEPAGPRQTLFVFSFFLQDYTKTTLQKEPFKCECASGTVGRLSNVFLLLLKVQNGPFYHIFAKDCVEICDLKYVIYFIQLLSCNIFLCRGLM